jgi:hypothetical protein
MGTNAKCSDEEIEAQIRSGKTQSQILETLKIKHGGGTVLRIRAISQRIGVPISRHPTSRRTALELNADEKLQEYLTITGGAKRQIEIQNGVVVIGSDAHFWPGIRTTAFRAFLKFCKDLKPRAVVLNGDSLDGAGISRHPRIGWQYRPTLKQEVDAVKSAYGEIEDAARTKELYWPAGNHDSRFCSYFAENAPGAEGIHGTDIKDHFPLWRMCWALHINDNTVVKHRFKGGANAAMNNALWAGRSIFTGHLHQAYVRSVSDYNGTRYGVDCGTMAQVYGPQFEDYTELSPTNWVSAFSVATYWKGKLLAPELVRVIDEDKGLVDFRGEVHRV